MKSFVALALAGYALATPVPQSDAPDGCSDSRDGTFQISVVNVTSSSLKKRQLDGPLTVTLEGGILTDQAGRIGSIVANHQWQFDNPVQDNAISTSGFSVCSNGSLAHGGSAIWHQCYSGGFYNIYDETIGEQCNSIYLIASGSSPGPVTQVCGSHPTYAATSRSSITSHTNLLSRALMVSPWLPLSFPRLLRSPMASLRLLPALPSFPKSPMASLKLPPAPRLARSPTDSPRRLLVSPSARSLMVSPRHLPVFPLARSLMVSLAPILPMLRGPQVHVVGPSTTRSDRSHNIICNSKTNINSRSTPSPHRCRDHPDQ